MNNGQESTSIYSLFSVVYPCLFWIAVLNFQDIWHEQSIVPSTELVISWESFFHFWARTAHEILWTWLWLKAGNNLENSGRQGSILSCTGDLMVAISDTGQVPRRWAVAQSVAKETPLLFSRVLPRLSIGSFSKRKGTSLDEGARSTKTKYGQIRWEPTLFHAPSHCHLMLLPCC